MKHWILLILLSQFIVSCVEAPPYETEKAVIDGWIDSEGYPVIIFTSSIVPDENNVSLEDKVIKWGNVTISDGEETIIMTGGANDEFFPPYRYTTYQMKGEPGKTYKISADYKDLHAEAQCTMPSPTPISGIELSPIEGNDSLRSAELKFITPNDVPAFYYVSIRNVDEKRRFYPAMLGTYKALQPGVEAKIPVLHPKNQIDDEDFQSQLKIGEVLEIHLCRVSEEVYRFWNSYDNSILFGGTQFFASTQSLEGNINGGYGIWSAQGVSSIYLEVK